MYLKMIYHKRWFYYIIQNGKFNYHPLMDFDKKNCSLPTHQRLGNDREQFYVAGQFFNPSEFILAKH
jgi:hypothetical protein